MSKPADLVQGTLDLLMLRVIGLEPTHGWAAEWALSENNRRAKYYRLTAAGRKALKTETARWARLSTAISLVVKPA